MEADPLKLPIRTEASGLGKVEASRIRLRWRTGHLPTTAKDVPHSTNTSGQRFQWSQTHVQGTCDGDTITVVFARTSNEGISSTSRQTIGNQ